MNLKGYIDLFLFYIVILFIFLICQIIANPILIVKVVFVASMILKSGPNPKSKINLKKMFLKITIKKLVKLYKRVPN